MKYKAETESKISIYKNSITFNGKTTLFFALKLYNYNIYSTDSISRQIDVLYNAIENIENVFGTIKFSIFKFTDIVSPDQYFNSLLKTIRLWDDKFMPSEDYVNNINYTTQGYCFLAINIDGRKQFELGDKSIKEMVKDYKDMFLDSLTSFKQQRVDTQKIDDLTSRICNVAPGTVKPCDEEVLVNFYIKRIYPSYNLVIPKEDYESTKAVLSYLKQDFIPHFNYFELSNAGVEVFGAKSRVTYATVVDIVEMPDEIISESFSLNHPTLVLNVNTLTKQQAKLKFMRKKRDIEYEEETSMMAGTQDLDLELQDYKDIADLALAAVSVGKKICETDIHLLITADSKEDLDKKRFSLISDLKNQDIIATFAPDQAKAYVDNFIKNRPTRYPFVMDLRYPLSFRLTNGAAAGDFDSGFTTPIFGETVSKGEATN